MHFTTFYVRIVLPKSHFVYAAASCNITMLGLTGLKSYFSYHLSMSVFGSRKANAPPTAHSIAFLSDG